MTSRNSLPDEEPVVITNAVTGLVTAVLLALIAFGVPVSAEQKVAIIGLIAPVVVVVFLVAAFIARRKTVPMVRTLALETKSGRSVAGGAYLDDGRSRADDPASAGDDYHDVPVGTPVIVRPVPMADPEPGPGAFD